MVKRISIIAIIAVISLLVVACGSSGKYKDGTYKGTGAGKNGSIKVEIAVEKGQIKTIKTLEHKETPGLSDPVFQKIYASMIKKQSPEVDAISGGTETSKGIIDAAKDALKNAK